MRSKSLRSSFCWCYLNTIALIVWSCKPCFGQQCGQAYLQTLDASLAVSKGGYQGCETTSPPTYYLSQTIMQNWTASSDGYSSGTYDITITGTYYPVISAYTNVYVGSANYEYVETSDSGSASMHSTNTEIWDNSTNALIADGIVNDIGDSLAEMGYATNTYACDSTEGALSVAGSWSDGSGDALSETLTESTNVSTQFTDDMLKSIIQGNLPPFPTTWTSGCGTASWHWGDTNHLSASGGKMKYRFHLTQTAPHTTYKITWHEVTAYPTGPPSSSKKSEEVAGNGDPVNGVYSSVHDVAMPSNDCTIYEVEDSVKIVSGGAGGT